MVAAENARKPKRRKLVFISYRRDGGAEAARLIRDRLVAAIGEDDVFFDEASIRGGEAFPKRISDAIRRSCVMLLLIHREWFDRLANDDGRTDYVFEEIVEAKEHSVTVIPVLVAGADRLPDVGEMPAPLRETGVLMNHAMRVSPGADFEDQINRLIRRVRELRGDRRWRTYALGMSAVCITAGVIVTVVARAGSPAKMDTKPVTVTPKPGPPKSPLFGNLSADDEKALRSADILTIRRVALIVAAHDAEIRKLCETCEDDAALLKKIQERLR